MAAAQQKKKKPPTFPFLPKTRARLLKRSWVQDHKIRSKWKAQKKREGLSAPQDVGVAEPASDPSPKHSDKPPSPAPAPSHNKQKQSLRDLRKNAYATVSSRRDGKRETGQPNMKRRMNVLLEKIKRDLS